MSDVLVSGVACDKNEAKITLVRCPIGPVWRRRFSAHRRCPYRGRHDYSECQ